MIKKTLFTIIIFFIIFSCGKKADPKYKDSQKKTGLQKILINKT